MAKYIDIWDLWGNNLSMIIVNEMDVRYWYEHLKDETEWYQYKHFKAKRYPIFGEEKGRRNLTEFKGYLEIPEEGWGFGNIYIPNDRRYKFTMGCTKEEAAEYIIDAFTSKGYDEFKKKKDRDPSHEQYEDRVRINTANPSDFYHWTYGELDFDFLRYQQYEKEMTVSEIKALFERKENK